MAKVFEIAICKNSKGKMITTPNVEAVAKISPIVERRTNANLIILFIIIL